MSDLAAALRKRLGGSKVARGKHVAGLLAAEYHGAIGELTYHPTDQFRAEFRDLKEFMRRAFQLVVFNGIEGDYAEFGSWGARTFTLAWGAARLVGHDAHLWSFDSFEGLPPTEDERDQHPMWQPGAMAMSEADFANLLTQRGIPGEAYTTVAGFYDETLRPEAAGPRPDRIAFAYIDCDMYTSTVTVLDFLVPRLQHGMVLALDDYYNYGSSAVPGERLAAAECFNRPGFRWQLVPYIQYGYTGMSFIVEDRSLGAAGWHTA